MRCSPRVGFLTISVLFLGQCTGIILSNEEQPKPSYTAGIKTARWKNPNTVQTHYNYSRVYFHNSPGASSQYVVTQTEKSQKVYPTYNAHSYGQKPQRPERIVEPNSQSGHTLTGHGHFASLVGRNIEGLPRTNRTIYKKKIQYKTVEVYKKCPEGATGQFVYYLSCNQFLNCWKGRGEAQNCAPGTLFNPKTLECDFPDKVECITGPRQNTLEGIPVQKSITQALCPKEFTGLIPNYTDCSKFINCNNGQYVSMDCPPGTLFDTNQNVCDFPYKSTCFHVFSTGYQNTTDFGYIPPQNLRFNQSGQAYEQLTGQYYGQNIYGLNQYGQQQGGYDQQFQSQNGFPGKQTDWNLENNRQQSGRDYQRYDGQFYQSPSSGGNYQLTQTTGIGQSGQSHRDGQYYQTHHGSGVSSGVDGQDSSHQHQIESKLDFGQDGNRTSQFSSGTSQQYGQTGCPLGTPNCGYNFGQNAYPQTGQSVCNPRTQNCYPNSGGFPQSSTQQQYGQGSGFSYISGQYCDPRTQNCAQSFGGSQVYGTGHSQNGGQSFGGSQTYGTGYSPSFGAGHSQHRGFPHTPSYQQNQSCNPQLQNCGQNARGLHYIVYRLGQNQTNATGQHNYNKVCNINDPTCHQTGTRNITKTKTNKEPKCPSGFQGITKHPTDCKKFLNCANGLTFIQDCAPGTLFNPSLKICDFPYNVDCTDTEAEEEEVITAYEENANNTDDWHKTYYEHVRQYGQNAGHGNIRLSTTARPETQVSSSQHGTYDQQHHYNQDTHIQAQGHYNQGESTFNQDRVLSQGPSTHQTHGVHIDRPRIPDQNRDRNQGVGSYDQGQSGYDWQQNRYGPATFKPLTPRPGHVTIVSSQGGGYDETTVSNINRGQIGIVNRPVHVQSGQNNKGKNNEDQNVSNFPDYVDVFDPDEQKNYGLHSTSPRSVDKSWPPPFPSTDVNADYVFEYDDGEPVTLGPENVFYGDKKKTTVCGKGDFYCAANSCISKTMVCDGQRDCQNGKDELGCQEYLERFTLRKNHHLDVFEKQRWMNISYTTCALLCLENTKFECRSFNYRKIDKTCFLTDSNIGLSGALRQYYPCDYYELKTATINCTKLYKCRNEKCITTGQLCDGIDDCGNREDEKNCRPEDFGYSMRLAGSNSKNEGRVEITAFGKTGYICDDQFGITDANVVCRELGFQLGAAEFKGNSYFARNLKENNTLYMMDDLNCFGNETTLLDCGFAGWGVHNCRDQEIAGVVCKTPQEKCGKGHWKCDTGNECVPYSFVCDGLFDCTDDSDEGAQHCEAPTELRLVNGTNNKEGRVEIKHHGVWGTVCDDDFNEDAGKVVCRYFGYKGKATVKKEAYFGEGEGPIWLDQVSCYGNETELHKCTHWNWGEHNCDHGEDVGVICSDELDVVEIQRHSKVPHKHDTSTRTPITSCGFRKDNQFLENDLIHARVVSGSVARKGDYPWQAALRVKGKEKSAHWCGAVVISSKWILTAAHCLQGYAKGAYLVVAGEYNTDEDEGTEQQKYIEEYFIHENFRKGHKMNNDIALIKLKGAGFALNEDVQPICLPDVSADYEIELNCTISGFGSVKSGTSAYSHNMMAAWIPIHNLETCKMPHVYGTALTEGMICAGFLDGGIDACDGDSGGPLACLDQGLFTLYGLTSWGQHCGYANKPGVYVKVAHYRQWIDDIIRKHS